MATKRAIGLDIGTSGVRAADVSLARRPVTLEGFGQVSLPAGAIRDGELIDQGIVAEALGQLWKRAGFRNKKVNVGVANQHVVVRAIDLPQMEEQELRGALQFQVQEHIPMPVEDAVLDFQILDEYLTESNERMMKVLVVAAQKDMVSSVIGAVTQAGLDPVGVDVTPLALVRALGERGGALGETSGGEAIIDVGAGITNIVVHEGGITRFVRILLIGGNQLTEALAAGMGVSFEDAEGMKQRVGLASAAGAPPSTESAPRILEDRAASYVDEIRGTLAYYQAQAEAVRVTRAVLTGGGSKLANLETRLADALRLPVEQGRTLQRVRLGKLGLSESQLADAEPLMAASVGLALGMAEE
ncbi:MAG: type IV pilus assembly protein PilM [Actinobacteria bacterium]|nr:type IV pilus assembly protein PilM [Actinomycetota bacterium]